MADRICSIPDCERLTMARGWCQPHYMRWWRHGAPLTGRPVKPLAVRRKCSVDGCDRRHFSRDYCELHYVRLTRLGADAVPAEGVRTGVLNGKWSGDDASYGAVHHRVRRLRGNAREHSCTHCGSPAVDWAYDKTCPNEKAEGRRGRLIPFSTDPARYMPLCRPCHFRFDGGAVSK